MTNKLYVETIREEIAGFVISSDVRPATAEEIDEAKRSHAIGQCKHNIIQDEYGWMYDFRSCAICGKGLGVV